MKLRTLAFSILLLGVLSLVAMSPDEKAEFKRQIKMQNNSDALRQFVQDKLGNGRRLHLDIDKAETIDVERVPGFVIEADGIVEITDMSRAVKNAVEEAFFEEMHPFVYGDEPIDQALGRFQKYTWANAEVVNNLRTIFEFVHNQVSPPGYVMLQKFIKNRVAEVSDENRILGGKNDFSERFAWFLHKNPGILGRYAIGGLAAIAVMGGIYYYWAGKKADEQDDEDNDDEQDNIKGDHEAK